MLEMFSFRKQGQSLRETLPDGAQKLWGESCGRWKSIRIRIIAELSLSLPLTTAGVDEPNYDQ